MDKDQKAASRAKSNANLKPWQPGQSGNPNGRPRGSRNLSTIIEEVSEIPLSFNGLQRLYEKQGKQLPEPIENLALMYPKVFSGSKKTTLIAAIVLRLGMDALIEHPKYAIQFMKEYLDRYAGKATRKNQLVDESGNDVSYSQFNLGVLDDNGKPIIIKFED